MHEVSKSYSGWCCIRQGVHVPVVRGWRTLLGACKRTQGSRASGHRSLISNFWPQDLDATLAALPMFARAATEPHPAAFHAATVQTTGTRVCTCGSVVRGRRSSLLHGFGDTGVMWHRSPRFFCSARRSGPQQVSADCEPDRRCKKAPACPGCDYWCSCRFARACF
jgi:hypothetical protein